MRISFYGRVIIFVFLSNLFLIQDCVIFYEWNEGFSKLFYMNSTQFKSKFFGGYFVAIKDVKRHHICLLFFIIPHILPT
jgi:hypothetical protein